MWNKSKNKGQRKSMTEKMAESITNTIQKPILDLKNKNTNDVEQLNLLLESIHAHLEKILEIEAKRLYIEEKKTGIKGVFDEDYYYKEKSFEKATKNKIQGKTITIKSN